MALYYEILCLYIVYKVNGISLDSNTTKGLVSSKSHQTPSSQRIQPLLRSHTTSILVVLTLVIRHKSQALTMHRPLTVGVNARARR